MARVKNIFGQDFDDTTPAFQRTLKPGIVLNRINNREYSIQNLKAHAKLLGYGWKNNEIDSQALAVGEPEAARVYHLDGAGIQTFSFGDNWQFYRRIRIFAAYTERTALNDIYITAIDSLGECGAENNTPTQGFYNYKTTSTLGGESFDEYDSDERHVFLGTDFEQARLFGRYKVGDVHSIVIDVLNFPNEYGLVKARIDGTSSTGNVASCDTVISQESKTERLTGLKLFCDSDKTFDYFAFVKGYE